MCWKWTGGKEEGNGWDGWDKEGDCCDECIYVFLNLGKMINGIDWVFKFVVLSQSVWGLDSDLRNRVGVTWNYG